MREKLQDRRLVALCARQYDNNLGEYCFFGKCFRHDGFEGRERLQTKLPISPSKQHCATHINLDYLISKCWENTQEAKNVQPSKTKTDTLFMRSVWRQVASMFISASSKN